MYCESRGVDACELRLRRRRQKGWVLLSKALKRPHVLATAPLDRSPFG